MSSSQVAKKPKKNKWRYLYFGYLLDDFWILEYARRNKLHLAFTPQALRERNIDPEDADVMTSLMMGSYHHIVSRAGLFLSSKYGSVLSPDGDRFRCVVLATNDHDDHLPFPPPEKYAKLKEILETTEEPRWYYAWVAGDEGQG